MRKEYKLKDEIIIGKLDLIIRLLRNIVFPREKVREIVVGKRRNVLNWIKVYNLCDGEYSKQGDIAKEAGVDEGDLSVELRRWGKIGIVFKVKNKEGDECYKAITYLDEKEE